MKWFLATLLILVISTTAQANNASFHEYFELKYNQNGEVDFIISKKRPPFSFKFYLNYLKQEIKDYLEYLRQNKSNPELFDKTLQNELGQYSKNNSDNLEQQAQRILDLLQNESVLHLAGELDVEMTKIPLKPYIIAAPTNSKYFYKLRVYEELFDWVFDRINDSLKTLPNYSVVRYIFDQAIGKLKQRQRYYQTLLLFYIENSERAQALGFDPQVVSHIRSSIQESRLGGFKDYFKSKKIQREWDTYGNKKFEKKRLEANEKLFERKREITNIQRLNFAFIQAVEESQPKYFNLINEVSQLDRRMSVALNMAEPKKIRFKRVHLYISQVALQYIPLPGFIKDKFSGYIGSQYGGHLTTEAALIGYLLEQGLHDEVSILSRQSLNPFIVADFD